MKTQNELEYSQKKLAQLEVDKNKLTIKLLEKEDELKLMAKEIQAQ